MKSTIYISLFCAAISVIGCKKKNRYEPVCDGSNITYTNYVSALISDNCISCHGPGSSNGDFSTYLQLSAATANGEFEEYVLEKQTMPKGSALSEDQLNKLQCWVNSGFPEN